jgi:hypothetical protein
MNLRDEVLPYKHLIGQVILDKNPILRTVVNKTGNIETEFRTFPMEVIAGEPNFDVTVKEAGCVFSFNFKDVYWNSRYPARLSLSLSSADSQTLHGAPSPRGAHQGGGVPRVHRRRA